jgi:hypoxanthine phosphoribosyltransferase
MGAAGRPCAQRQGQWKQHPEREGASQRTRGCLTAGGAGILETGVQDQVVHEKESSSSYDTRSGRRFLAKSAGREQTRSRSDRKGPGPAEAVAEFVPAVHLRRMNAPLELISASTIASRVAELGREIEALVPEGPLTVVGILRGAFVFMADLVRTLRRPITCDFLGVRSYGDATVSSGVVEITSDLGTSISGKQVLLIEDIVDTGLTLKYLQDLLYARTPAGLTTCALLSKPSRRKIEVKVDFLGFEVPDEFVVGYGLDAGQLYRNLPYIGVFKL